jgi:hypothetical protein
MPTLECKECKECKEFTLNNTVKIHTHTHTLEQPQTLSAVLLICYLVRLSIIGAPAFRGFPERLQNVGCLHPITSRHSSASTSSVVADSG